MDVQNTIGGSLQISTDVLVKIARLAALDLDMPEIEELEDPEPEMQPRAGEPAAGEPAPEETAGAPAPEREEAADESE